MFDIFGAQEAYENIRWQRFILSYPIYLLDDIQENAKELYYKAKERGVIAGDAATEQRLSSRLKWTKDTNGELAVDFLDIHMPISALKLDKKERILKYNYRGFHEFQDSLLAYYAFNDNYSKEIVEFLAENTREGPYGYVDGDFKVTVERGDVVIDAGACIGEFSVYAAVKGAYAYAFEPSSKNSVQLNQFIKSHTDKITHVELGLSDKEESLTFSLSGSASSFVTETKAYEAFCKDAPTETINVITLDKFVEDNNIEKIDFIKADIEGAERQMLTGATNVLKKFAPKLAICTYHLPDDPEVLERIIMEANPKYRVIHIKMKLFAAVVE